MNGATQPGQALRDRPCGGIERAINRLGDCASHAEKLNADLGQRAATLLVPREDGPDKVGHPEPPEPPTSDAAGKLLMIAERLEGALGSLSSAIDRLDA